MVLATEDPPRSPPTSRHLTSPLTFQRELRRCRLAWRLPPTRSHGGSQGFKSPHLHPQNGRSERRQRRAGDAHCMFRPRCGRKFKSQFSREALRVARGLGPRPHHDHAAWSPPAANRRVILARIPPLPVGHPVDLAHCLTTAPRRRPSRSRPAVAQHDLCQPRGPGSNLGQTTRRRGHGGRPRRPRPSHPCGCRPHRHAPRPYSGRTQRTPDTGHLDAQTPAPDTDHLDRPRGTPHARTGHRTPDTGHEDADTMTTGTAGGPDLLGRHVERPHAETPKPCYC